MFQIVKHMEIKGEEGKRISNVITSVINEFQKRADVAKLDKLEIYVTTNPVKVARQIFSEDISLERNNEIRGWIAENTPSFTYWSKGKTPIIMLNANESIFRESNFDAMQGLFAHELMHLLNKLDGIEDFLEEMRGKSSGNVIALLEKHNEVKPFTRERLLVSFIRVTNTTVLYMKDILANSRAMSFGFDEEIYENYKFTLREAKKIRFTENEILKSLKKDKKHILDDVFLAYIGLNMTWVTFKMFKNKWYKYLQQLSRIDVPKIIKKEGNQILKELLKLRSGQDSKQIFKILKTSQNSYYNVVEYFCKRLKE